MSTEPNPYASPAAEADLHPAAPDEMTEAEAIRRLCLAHESAVRSVGLLYYTVAGVFLAGGAFEALWTADRRGNLLGPAVLGLFYVGVAAVLIAFGRGLRVLRRWVRVPVILISIVGFMQFPFGTVIHGYILYLVASAKGATVLSREYQEIIRKTPYVQPRMSLLAWLVLLLAILLLGSAVVLMVAG